MKKFLTFLALCCLVVTGAWAQTVVTTPQVSTNDATYEYTLECRSSAAHSTARFIGIKDGHLDGQCATGGKFQFEDAGDGKYYIFTIVGEAKKYFNWTNSVASLDESGTTKWEFRTAFISNTVGLAPEGTASGKALNNNGGTNNLQMGNFTGSGNACSHWEMKEYSNVEQTYTVHITGLEGATVTYSGTAYSDGQSFTATGLDASQLTVPVETGYYPPTVNIGTGAINVTYEKFPFEVASSVDGITHWYALNINSNTNNYLSSNGTAIALSSTYESTAAYAWGFVGNASTGYAVYNKATGAYISNADPCALASEGFHWEVAKGVNGSKFNSGGFCLGEPNKTGNSKYINLQNGALKRWSADQGSTFNVVEITPEEPVTPGSVEVPYTLTPADGATITSVDDLATITLQFTGEDVEEGLMPMTAEDMEREPVYPTLTKGTTVITATSIAMNDYTGFYDITFPTTDITDGEWILSIPEGAFYTMDWLTMSELVVAEITATYNVSSAAPAEVVATLTINGVETNYYEGSDIVLNDGATGLTKVVIPNDVDDIDVAYTRTFTGNNATAWQAWYVPFRYTLTSEDVDAFDFAYIWTLGVDVKTGMATNIIYEDLVAGDVLKANTPYLIKAKAATTEPYEFKATGLCATEENHIDCSTTKFEYDFVGNYESFVLSEQPYYALDNSGAFAYTSSATYKLQPYRYYMYITEKKTNSILDPHSSSNVQKMTLIHRGENDEQTTSINTINRNDDHATTVDLTGRIVSNPRAGVFISNGKKCIIK